MFLEGIEEAGGDVVSKLDVNRNVPVLCFSSNIIKKIFKASKLPFKLTQRLILTCPNINCVNFVISILLPIKAKCVCLLFLSEEASSNFRIAFSVFKTICT
jgi:hypothetical protein